MTMPMYPGSHMYAQRPVLPQQPQTAPPHVAYQQDTNIHASAMTTPQPSFTQTHQVQNVQVFSGGPDCKILIEDWIWDMKYLLDAGGMLANLCFTTIVRHLSGEAIRLVLNLPPNSRLPAELLKSYELNIVICRHLWTHYLYERCPHCGPSTCTYAIALDATLRSVEEAQYGGQTFPDRDSRLTHQFMRVLSNKEVYQWIAPMKLRLLTC